MGQKRKYFGTDGIRGEVGSSLINPEFIIKLGWAIGRVFGDHNKKNHILIGKDTRISGYMIESALASGLSAAGVGVHLLGPMPTPAIAYLTRTLRARAGIVISASHNPYHDNGIKLFSHEGRKLPSEIELAIEKELSKPLVVVESKYLGKASRVSGARDRYIEFCKGTVPPKTSLRGLKIVIDCANGSSYHIAPNVFKELGASVVSICDDPNGLNINYKCGSTNINILKKKVLQEKADLGLALDGDGDRVLMVDHLGEIVDGDEILYIIAKRGFENKSLKGGVVGTVMSNMGLEKTLKAMGIKFVRVKVGDRYIVEELIKRNWALGGEQSGHIIKYDINETGDGVISALQVVEAMVVLKKKLHELKEGMHKYPQILKNLKVKNISKILKNAKVKAKVKEAEKTLGDSGRIVIRPSGTEPLLRIMVEGKSLSKIRKIVKGLVDTIDAEI